MRHNIGDNHAWIEHDGIVNETADAVQYSIEGEPVWIPRSQIKDENDELVAIPKWLAEKKNLTPSW